MVFVFVAALIWWRARSSGFFFIVGLQGSASANLGPLLPALCGGLTASLVLLMVDSVAGVIAGFVAVLVVVSLPGFVPMHRDSLTGPPLLAIVLTMFAAMVGAPRFSLAYGSLGAVGGLFVATEGIGLPIAAAAWALWPRSRENGRWQRVALALAPTAVVVLLAHLLGGAWPHGMQYGWRGGLDRGLHAAGALIGNQVTPTITTPAIRFLVIADFTVILVAVVVAGWRRALHSAPDQTPLRALYPTAALLVGALAIGLAGRTLLVQGTPEPDLSAVMPLMVLTAMVMVVSLAQLWRSWPLWGRAATVVLLAGWVQAAWRA